MSEAAFFERMVSGRNMPVYRESDLIAPFIRPGAEPLTYVEGPAGSCIVLKDDCPDIEAAIAELQG